MHADQSRRNALKNLVTGTAALGTAPLLSSFTSCDDNKPFALKGNIQHSACRWCYDSIPLEELCIAAKEIGLIGIDLVGPKDLPTLKKHGLLSTMCNGAEINLVDRSEEHTSELQSHHDLVCRL